MVADAASLAPASRHASLESAALGSPRSAPHAYGTRYATPAERRAVSAGSRRRRRFRIGAPIGATR